jgi:adenosylcobinamide-GDP ribazoletransferase
MRRAVNRPARLILHEVRLFFVALQFLTRVPVPRWVGFEPDWLNQAARHLPLAGACVGAVGAAVYWLGSLLFPPTVAAVLSIASTVLLTGAFHEDGLADTFDALGGAVSRERALEIMKDSRIGSYGAVALTVVLGLKAAVLGAMLPPLAMPALVLAHTASRAAAVVLIRCLPYAGDLAHAKAKPLAQQVSRAGVTVALAWSLVLAGALVLFAPDRVSMVLGSLIAAFAAALCCARWLRRRLGGYTGDGLGATQQLTESALLLGWLAAVRWGT